jgi:hypothetical protein
MNDSLEVEVSLSSLMAAKGAQLVHHPLFADGGANIDAFRTREKLALLLRYTSRIVGLPRRRGWHISSDGGSAPAITTY